MPGRRPLALPLVAFAAVATLGAAACDTGDGRELTDPPPGATAPPLASSTTPTTGGAVLGTPPVGSGDDVGSVMLTSPSFVDGGAIPAVHSCDGDDRSPALSWTGVPPETVEIALTVVDPDAPGAPLVHQVVTGIDPVVTGIGEGGVPESAVEVQPWTGPCPPPGETHRYVFTLYALSARSGVDPASSVEDAQAALESTPGPTAVLTGTYSRPA